VVHGIVTKHEGAITLESDLGKGTTVTVLFPVFQERGEAKISSYAEEIPGGEERVLLVDDEEPQVRTLRGALERLGYRVVGKTDPQQALELFRSEPGSFDLVITDENMPKLPGDKLAEEVLHIRPDIAIILCTGSNDMIDEQKARAMGIRGFALKPFSIRELADMIKKTLSEK
jgi:CheY-like chemotaxis protein